MSANDAAAAVGELDIAKQGSAALSAEASADGGPDAEAKKAEREAKKAAKAAEKAAKEAAKAARAEAEAAARLAAATRPDPADPPEVQARYGDAEMVQSRPPTGRVWTPVGDLTPALAGARVLVRARVHAVRSKGKAAFLVLRQGTATAQGVLFVDDAAITRGMVRYASALTRESIVDVEGVVAVPEAAIEACSQSGVEVKVDGLRCVSRAAALPFEVADAARPPAAIAAAAARGEHLPGVGTDTRLDWRCVDLRTPANQAIFRLQSAVCRIFRDTLASLGFIEIHTPKLLGGASEGGAAVFRTDYFGRPACLAQSPQFYKQMAVAADLGRVFEVGPVFRAEQSFTHRHLCEFTGLDFEMPIHETYEEVLDVVDALFTALFTGLTQGRNAADLAVVGEQYPFEPLRFAARAPRIPFSEGVAMLAAAGHAVDPLGDLNTEAERLLGRLVREKHGTDFFILTRFPLAVRPFYTMPAPDDARYSNSYDVFLRGEEIISGAQRVHDYDLLRARAAECGVPLEAIAGYADAFRHGAPPHGGVGVGLERVVMLYLGLDNVRKASLFPRDPKRLDP